MSKRKQRAYPKMVKRRMVEDVCNDYMFNLYLLVILVSLLTGWVYLHICLLKPV